ncbi:hypothetical protein ACH47Z_08840 [Streptomyces sp. NPDC020192]|uniref:hypothetical protein n=1 Tax=Streptomyces sp. NPDC020192 TaxID=3365066 RepID=UPI0037959621
MAADGTADADGLADGTVAAEGLAAADVVDVDGLTAVGTVEADGLDAAGAVGVDTAGAVGVEGAVGFAVVVGVAGVVGFVSEAGSDVAASAMAWWAASPSFLPSSGGSLPFCRDTSSRSTTGWRTEPVLSTFRALTWASSCSAPGTAGWEELWARSLAESAATAAGGR